MLTKIYQNGIIDKYLARDKTYKYVCKLVNIHLESTYTNLYFFVPKNILKIFKKYVDIECEK